MTIVRIDQGSRQATQTPNHCYYVVRLDVKDRCPDLHCLGMDESSRTVDLSRMLLWTLQMIFVSNSEQSTEMRVLEGVLGRGRMPIDAAVCASRGTHSDLSS